MKNLLLLASMKNVVLIDDHKVLLDGLKTVLEGISNVGNVRVFDNPVEFLNQLPDLNPDLIITDYQMPEMNGLELVSSIRTQRPLIPIMMISMFNDPNKVRQLYKLGINGYIQKKFSAEVLKDGIATVLGGRNYFDEEIIRIIQEEDSNPKGLQLSPREIEILFLLGEEKSTTQIADQLCISHHTVETYRKNLLRKFGVKKTVGLVKHAVELKLI